MREILPAPLQGCETSEGRVVLNGLSSSVKLAIKLVIEFMPLGLFFLASTHYGFWISTAVLMVATVISLLFTWWLFQQLALMAMITAATSLVAGGITLILSDPMYVQMKPTIVGFIFAAILLTGLLSNKPLFKILLGQNLHLNEEGWRVLTWLWFAYFIFISGLNEFIWRNYTWEFWAAFKAFGLMPMTVAYALPQMVLLKKYRPLEVSPSFAFDKSHAKATIKPRPADAAAETSSS
jgi:intracellular septation protein